MPIFNRTDLSIEYLTKAIDSGSIGLPELQRPFVWGDNKARDLLKSMLKGFPIGFLILWTQPEIDKSKQIGISTHSYGNPNELIIDGQQRLTTLYSIITGKQVLDSSFNKRRIIISYNPTVEDIDEALDVGNEAYKKSPDWIYDITTIFMSNNLYDLCQEHVLRKNESLKKKGLEMDPNECNRLVGDLMNKLSNFKSTILNYPFPVLKISSEADEENVADIFVNINSGGTKLNQSDFILTLVSVHYPEGRGLIESFCRDTKYHIDNPKEDICNPIISFEPADVIRVVMAYGFKRGRLKYGYKLLRGADLDKKGAISEELRNMRFDKFKSVLDQVLDRDNFKEFLKCVNAAGFVTNKLLPSNTNITYAYAFWLIGKYDFGIGVNELKKIISKTIYFFNLTSRYSASFESLVENELIELSDLATNSNKESFSTYFSNVEKAELTNDFFNITLVDKLKSSSNQNPAFLTYIAAQNILGAKVLFSKPSITTVSSFDEWVNGSRKAVELHHLFPKNYLKTLDFKNKEINQVANYAFIEWPDNMDISDEAPSKYFKKQVDGLSGEEIKDMLKLHALPYGWEDLSYNEFLEKRRELMTKIIKDGFDKLSI